MDSSRPTFIHVYLPNGEVDILTECTDVFTKDGVLQFVDREGQLSRTNLPFLVMWDAKASRAELVRPPTGLDVQYEGDTRSDLRH